MSIPDPDGRRSIVSTATQVRKRGRRSGLPKDPIIPERPCPRHDEEQFVLALLEHPDQSTTEVFMSVFPQAQTWLRKTVYEKSSRLYKRVSQRLLYLMEQAASKAVMSLTERKEMLTRIARDVGDAKLGDYLEAAGGQGAYVTLGPDSPRPLAVKKVRTVTKMDDTGDGATITTDVELHSKGDAIAAIQELNKMERVYKGDGGDIDELIGNGIVLVYKNPHGLPPRPEPKRIKAAI